MFQCTSIKVKTNELKDKRCLLKQRLFWTDHVQRVVSEGLGMLLSEEQEEAHA